LPGNVEPTLPGEIEGRLPIPGEMVERLKFPVEIDGLEEGRWTDVEGRLKEGLADGTLMDGRLKDDPPDERLKDGVEGRLLKLGRELPPPMLRLPLKLGPPP